MTVLFVSVIVSRVLDSFNVKLHYTPDNTDTTPVDQYVLSVFSLFVKMK